MTGIPSIIDVTDINGSNGFRIVGSSLWEETGSSVSIGDVNGDGLADVIVGAPDIVSYPYEIDYSAYVIFGHGSDDIPIASTVSAANLDLNSGLRVSVG